VNLVCCDANCEHVVAANDDDDDERVDCDDGYDYVLFDKE
jgi:hypothetical protein